MCSADRARMKTPILLPIHLQRREPSWSMTSRSPMTSKAFLVYTQALGLMLSNWWESLSLTLHGRRTPMIQRWTIDLSGLQKRDKHPDTHLSGFNSNKLTDLLCCGSH